MLRPNCTPSEFVNYMAETFQRPKLLTVWPSVALHTVVNRFREAQTVCEGVLR